MTHRRDKIENFCRNFLYGNSGHQQLHELIGNYEREFLQNDILQLFTKYTFDGSFQSVCNDLFEMFKWITRKNNTQLRSMMHDST